MMEPCPCCNHEYCEHNLCPCCNYPECGHSHGNDLVSPKNPAVCDDIQLFGITPEMVADFIFGTTITFFWVALINSTLSDKYRWPWLNVVILSLVAGYGYYKGRNKAEKS
jgi:hypothetical protein